jgi:predicted phosphate transport protein (TIGR00153 family)
MSNPKPRLLRRLVNRVFPSAPDFFSLLGEQAAMMVHSVGLLVKYMKTGDPEVGEQVRANEHEADKLKARNLHVLNEAFSTPFDREDLYRAITHLDHVVNYCKSTVNEMDLLQVQPDDHTLAMVERLEEGAEALKQGFEELRRNPAEAMTFADAGRKAERRMEKLYRAALADLFQGDDYLGMFKRREIYRHISNAGDRLARAANTLHDIVVKIS